MKKTDKYLKTLIMDFSGIYEEQQFWKGKEASWVEARDIPGTNCYCDEDAMNEIRSRIAPYSSGEIHFIDSGNYHYMTRIWLEKISEPFDLLVFDNHTDMQPPAFGGLLSCGGWIYDSVMELPLLQKVILIGPDEEAFSRVEPEIQKKVEFLSREKLRGMELMEILDFVKEQTGKNPLYISIDKDVLCPEDADTNWSQGDMRLETMVRCLECAVTRCKAGDILSTGSENADIGQLDAVREDTQKDGAACSDLTVTDLCLFPGILGVDICGECDASGTGNSALNDYANARLWGFFRHAAENETSGGDR